MPLIEVHDRKATLYTSMFIPLSREEARGVGSSRQSASVDLNEARVATESWLSLPSYIRHPRHRGARALCLRLLDSFLSSSSQFFRKAGLTELPATPHRFPKPSPNVYPFVIGFDSSK